VLKEKLKTIWEKARRASKRVGIAMVLSALTVRLGIFPEPIQSKVTEASAAAVQGDHYIIPNDSMPQVTSLIQTILMQFKIARPEISDSQIVILSSGERNAFSLPDGRVYLNIGMLSRIESISQLAGVIGHEIGHRELKSQRALVATKVTTIGASLFFLGTTGLWTLVVSIPLGLLAERFIQRQQEYACDMFAVSLMRDAGFDSSQFGTFLGTRFHTQGYNPPLDDVRELLSTHPVVYKRALKVLSQ